MNENSNKVYDVIIIGAGPSGAVAAALLEKKGYRTVVLENQHFPRFSIGESLLPQCMRFLEEADLLPAVQAAGFQMKNGASFVRGDQYSEFDFRKGFSVGWGTTFQVQRGQFDKILADGAARIGAEIRYGHTVLAMTPDQNSPTVTVKDETGEQYQLEAKFVLDASGFGRVLPRLLDLELPSDLSIRRSVFTHVEDNIDNSEWDREKIRITVHPTEHDIWYWLIPFSNGRSSVGVIATPEYLEKYNCNDEQTLKILLAEEPSLTKLLRNCVYDTDVQALTGYSKDVKQLCGPGYALLGNAGEFLDPVFSSGVTIALKSASLAVEALDKHLQGENVDWQKSYAEPLQVGVDTFRAFVESWYETGFQDIIFSKDREGKVRSMLCSILAGYAWDEANPYTQSSKRRVAALVELCRID